LPLAGRPELLKGIDPYPIEGADTQMAALGQLLIHDRLVRPPLVG
jgi:hypothetical protein